MGRIICGYSGIGKSTAVNNYEFNGFELVELESSEYPKDKTWPADYVDHIIEVANEKDNLIVCCSCHEEVRMELAKRNVPFAIVAPKEDLLYEYTKRWYLRGSSNEFIRRMQTGWSAMHQSLYKHGDKGNVIVILLDKGEYLADLFNGVPSIMTKKKKIRHEKY